ncbi:F-type H+-transporting ATPase subunit F [Blastomyces parvus]|uniref:F-type H+-transporting ATPase subunit F n=1 Tax=Blastomyces parvus TaxID=2060905 RepID=A0A2B7WXW0_9EURO|nr:F-type H+-transporting ATPase subunit F [Blastomyces parvus]
MSYVARRGLSTLIPPKVASPTGIGAAQDAARMERIVGFYEKLPRGAAPEIKPTGLLGRYQARYFGKNPSAMPLIHVIGGLMLLGYSMDYYFHLREFPSSLLPGKYIIVQQANSSLKATTRTMPIKSWTLKPSRIESKPKGLWCNRMYI